jgi:hypothetical protein
MRTICILSCLLFLAPGILRAQATDDTQERLKALEERIIALEAEIRALKAAQATAPAAAPAAESRVEAATAAPPASVPPALASLSAAAAAKPLQSAVQASGGTVASSFAQLPVYSGESDTAKVFNPAISVIGNFLGAAGRDPVRDVPALDLSEAEIGLQATVDPYARGDFFISLGSHGAELEEGYLTFTSLPGGFVPKVGKMRSSFGVVNALHTHSLPWADRPLVTENLLGGEEGINDAGISVSRILPAPKDIFLEATGQVLRGESEEVFATSKRSDLAFVGRLRGYGDLSESSNLDLGFSYARGHNDVGSAFRTQLFGMDATFRWRPLRRGIYHSFLARSELVWSRRQEELAIQRAFGFYSSADYRLTRRWTLGGRYDRSDRAQTPWLTDSGFSPVVTYWPSEFSQIRGQYRFTRYADGRSGNDLMFQFLFVLGAHGAHPF